MSDLLHLRGRRALSPFRLAKLTSALRAAEPSVGAVDAEFVHFVRSDRPLQADEQVRLERLLEYGPRSGEVARKSWQCLVVPRLGTLSPWSSKATDIARLCGLPCIQRIERGTAFHLDFAGATPVGPALAAIRSLLHDPMTESILDDAADAARLFHRDEPAPLERIALGDDRRAALQRANVELGLALSEDEVDYLVELYTRAGRDPTDVELTMFAQVNSEHCRHKIFNARWTIDGVSQSESLFGMIRTTHRDRPQGTLVAYEDNSAVIAGQTTRRFHPAASDRRYVGYEAPAHILLKVETHNHPTAIAPFPGAATGSGGEIRDEGATGIGAKPKAGLVGFAVSDLRIPGALQPWEAADAEWYGKPARIASALSIMLEGPIGAAAFNNEFGRPNLAGYFRTLETRFDGEMRGFHKPIMIAGGIGAISEGQVEKHALTPGALFVQLGGPGMRIGLGGGAASSMASGANTEQLDFDSVQRANPEIQRRAQEVIDRCWQLGADNPILSIHDVGAGGLSNALPELAHGGGVGATFELRDVPSDEPGMSPREIWCNEAQERYVLAIAPDDLERFRAICLRERCPFAVVGRATADGLLRVEDRRSVDRPVDLDLAALLGKTPRMHRDVVRKVRAGEDFEARGIDPTEALLRVLQLPAVSDKRFLVTIGDRTVGGLCARDPLVGRWQVAVADCAVTLAGFDDRHGEAYALGERHPVALLDAPASGRLAVAEAITNLAAARIDDLGLVRLSANWMGAAGHPGEDAALFDTVRAVAMELCPALGISIPVGKDSLSMRSIWRSEGEERRVTAPVSLVVTALAPCADAGATLTPELVLDRGETDLVLVDLSAGRDRLGASALAQVYGRVGAVPPDLDRPDRLAGFFGVVQRLARDGLVLAYHDRSDGGLVVTLCEMMFAARCGLTVELRAGCEPVAAMFAEEPGAVLQVPRAARAQVLERFAAAGLAGCVVPIGAPVAGDRLTIRCDGRTVVDLPRSELQRAWSALSFRMQTLRDNPDCAREEDESARDERDPGLHAHLTFDLRALQPPPALARRPRVAVLREQGVNGHVEMAAAFDRAGFDAYDVHMSDILEGRVDLGGFAGFAACGGFSYGDVLGAGEGWAKSILFNARARNAFERFFARPDTFALGVCNGCQMMSALREIIPGAEHWPRFVRNRSEQFEARVAMVEIQRTPSLFFAGMEGSRIPVPVAHGEGQVEFAAPEDRDRLEGRIALRFVDGRGEVATRYPANPNGSIDGITGVTSTDGRFTILMPHPERAFRTVQNSWHPREWNEESPWMRMFRNARAFVGT